MAESSEWSRVKARMELREAKERLELQVNDWVEDAVRDFEARGGMEHVQGKGKPLRLEPGDPINGVLKTANFKPAWLELQHEIRDALRGLKEEFERGTAVQPDRTLQAINLKIARYNTLVPHYSMQKPKVDASMLARQLESWE